MRFVWLDAAHGDRVIPVNPEQICYLMDGGEHTLVVFSAATGGTGLHSIKAKGKPRDVAERIEAATQNRAVFLDEGEGKSPFPPFILTPLAEAAIERANDEAMTRFHEVRARQLERAAAEGKPTPDLEAIYRAGAAMTRAQEILAELGKGSEAAERVDAHQVASEASSASGEAQRCPLCKPGQDCEHTEAERAAVARDLAAEQAASKPQEGAAPAAETTAAPGATGALGRGRGKR